MAGCHNLDLQNGLGFRAWGLGTLNPKPSKAMHNSINRYGSGTPERLLFLLGLCRVWGLGIIKDSGIQGFGVLGFRV